MQPEQLTRALRELCDEIDAGRVKATVHQLAGRARHTLKQGEKWPTLLPNDPDTWGGIAITYGR
jgi:hypothetical protein